MLCWFRTPNPPFLLVVRPLAHAVVHETLSPGDGGIIALDHEGTIVMEFNTKAMSRAAADSKGRFEIHVTK